MGSLHELARLNTIVSVVDAFNLFHNFSTSEFLSDRYGSGSIIAEDERKITDLMADQIEFADVIVVNKIESVDAVTRARVLGPVSKLTPPAKDLNAKYSAIDVKDIINIDSSSMEKAATDAGWPRSLHERTQMDIGGKTKMVPQPETVEFVPTQ